MRIFIYLSSLLILFFLAIGAAQIGAAGTRAPETADEKHVEFGKEFPAVVRIKLKCAEKFKTPEGELLTVYQVGSAVIIRPNWCLTAAHIFNGAVGAPTIIMDDGSEIVAAKSVSHPDFNHDKIGWHDIALVYTPQTFKLLKYPTLYEDFDELNKLATISGYGDAGTFHTGGGKYDHRRRAGRNMIDRVVFGMLTCTASPKESALPLEFLIAPGDSGGGLFIDDKLAGISSFIAGKGKPTGKYGDEACFTRVSLYVPWVERQIENHEMAMQSRATLSAEPMSLIKE